MNTKSAPKDVFMHLLAVITLYISAGSFINLVFQLINIGFPDPLRYDVSGSALRWAIASLIILFPVFLWVSRSITRDIAAHHEKQELRIRKWLLYFTLFAAAGFIIGDLIALIFNFLEGELTARFLLKAGTVLAVAAAVFWYYRYDLRRKPGEFSSGVRTFAWVVIAAVIAGIITGFTLAGSPFKQRDIRFDNERVNDLQVMQNGIVNFWQQKDALPASLDDLRDSISGFVPPVDPESGKPYAYAVTGATSFSLCATFNFSSDEALAEGYGRTVYPEFINGPGIENNWSHGAGEACFDRTIDPELYSITKPALR
jgi:hypothetical protein